MPPIAAGQIAEVMVTVAVVLAGFAFAGFVFILTRPKLDASSEELERRFGAVLFLIGAFSVGTFSAFLYATSTGVDPWPAYRSLMVAHASFVLLSIVTVAAVVRLLALEDRSKSIMAYAWFMASVMITFFQVRYTAELARAEFNLSGGSDTAAWVLVIASVIVLAAAWAIALAGSAPDRVTEAIPYTSSLAAIAIGVGLLHIYVGFIGGAGSLPTWLTFLLLASTSLFAGWSIIASRPFGASLRGVMSPPTSLRPPDTKLHGTESAEPSAGTATQGLDRREAG